MRRETECANETRETYNAFERINANDNAIVHVADRFRNACHATKVENILKYYTKINWTAVQHLH